MKVLIVIAALIAVSYCYTTSEQIGLFKDFVLQYNKTYNSAQEMQERFEIFKTNLDIAKKLDDADPNAQYGVTVFMDLSKEEFAKWYLMPKEIYANFELDGPVMDPSEIEIVDLPTDFDWRNKGAVTAVYNQGQCGSCWAFSATETIESFNEISKQGLKHDSMQQIVDCDTTSYGCNGGWTSSAYNYVIGAGGIESLSQYPYTAENGQCQFKSQDIQEKIASWAYVTQNDDESLMQNYMYTKGPLSVCVDASSWQTYQGGVITSCGQQLDHCVQATGFSTQQGIPAWNVRNSWGTEWGLQGYLYVERGQNMCGIGTTVTGVVAP